MLSFNITRQDGKIVSAQVTDYSPDAENRNDWKSFDAALEVATALGSEYLAIDCGPHVYPRFDVIQMPKVGDDVSYGFNGDCYPAGQIARISGQNFRRIETTEGKVFWRRKLTGSWINEGTWSLCRGHISKRNPEF